MASLTERWQKDVLGSTLTSIKIGGSVAWVSRPGTEEELEADCAYAKEQGIPFWMIGAGSNLVLPDEGFNGLVIIPANRQTTILEDASYIESPDTTHYTRYSKEEDMGFLELSEKEIPTGQSIWVRLGAGVPWGQAVIWTLDQGATGLHWYARIPCAVGGAVYNNIHGEKHLLSEVVQEVRSYSPEKGWVSRFPSQLTFGYDVSVFHTAARDEVIWDITFRLTKPSTEVVAAARDQYLEWTRAKVTAQPSGANCGSVFQNIDPTQVEEGASLSAAWYIDQTGCKGWQEGDMEVSNHHANFMNNRGNGTQAQARTLVERVREAVQAKFGLVLMPEVEFRLANGERLEW